MNSILYSFWDTIDVAENSKRGLQAVKGINGYAALLMLIPFSFLIIAFGLLSWYFDLSATSEWTQHAVKEIWKTIPESAATFIGWTVVCIIILPTLVELFMARFAITGIKFAAIIVFCVSLFDMVTDWPRVVQFTDGYKEAFDQLGFLSVPVFFAVRLLWLFLASFAFESLFLVFCVVWISLLFQTKRTPVTVNNKEQNRNRDKERQRMITDEQRQRGEKEQQ